MIKINLVTSKNDLIIPVLLMNGFQAEKLQPGNDIYSITKNTYTLLEIPELNPETAVEITGIIKSLDETSRIICFCETMSPEIKTFLLKNGIADCIQGSDPVYITRYLKSINMICGGSAGKFLVLDDNTIHKRILASVIQRFGYGINFISTIDDLFKTIGDPENIMLLINMGTGNLDMNAVVRKSYNNPDIKKIPVVAYKSMEQGLFLHEIINGLNRLTKIILSPEELYSMLTDMLFKKEIMSFSSSYIDSLKYPKFFPFAEKNLQQIYYEIQSNPCGQDSLFDTGRIDSLIQHSKTIFSSLVAVQGISWLANTGVSEKKVTCGGGV